MIGIGDQSRANDEQKGDERGKGVEGLTSKPNKARSTRPVVSAVECLSPTKGLKYPVISGHNLAAGNRNAECL